MRKVFSILAQFLLFFLIFLGGTLLDPFHIRWFLTHPSPSSTRYFVPDGLILMILLYTIILLVEMLMKKLRVLGPWTSVAFIFALVLGLLSKFGLATHDLY